MDAIFFWLLALATTVFALAALDLADSTYRLTRSGQQTPRLRSIIRGQRQDAWLAVAAILAVNASAQMPFAGLLRLGASVLFVWLTRRVLLRFAVLQRQE